MAVTVAWTMSRDRWIAATIAFLTLTIIPGLLVFIFGFLSF
jgi:hypothetical protein